MRFAWLALVGLLALAPATARAQLRRVEVHFRPTLRGQIAVWIESEDGELFRTLGLTERTAYFGIGNRPGALQMNSAFHWPYGRREGVLPVWAHRRYEATHLLFPRVIFAGRTSEGFASISGDSVANTRDLEHCLSFTAGDEDLDAVSCATVFSSNKGRYLTEADVLAGYAEPWEEPGGTASMRVLVGPEDAPLGSYYPPRQDLVCEGTECRDHPDTQRYRSDSLLVMPELDVVTMATPPGDEPALLELEVPDEWPDGVYVAYVEINTEGDYAPTWDAARFPTPTLPGGRWDSWAIAYGYPYRGQPSVVYEVRFQIDSDGGEWNSLTPLGYGDLHGRDGVIRPMDGTISDDPLTLPGSGADRLRSDSERGDARVRVVVPPTDICARPVPPVDCGRECTSTRPCPSPLMCGPAFTCVDRCELEGAPGAPSDLVLEHHADERRSHEWVRMQFVVPGSERGIRRYEVRVGTREIVPGDESTFEAARPAQAAVIEDQALVVPTTGAAGTLVELEVGHLQPSTRYWIGIRAFDECSVPGEIVVAEIVTTQIYFTTVSPCFVATAAYGSPLDARIGVLRRFRDRHLMPSAAGRALVDAYYAVGPSAAAWIAETEDRRAAARAVLSPVVTAVEALED